MQSDALNHADPEGSEIHAEAVQHLMVIEIGFIVRIAILDLRVPPVHT